MSHDTGLRFTPRHVTTNERADFRLAPESEAAAELLPRSRRRWMRLQLVDGTLIEAQRAACGLGCRCDAVYRVVSP